MSKNISIDEMKENYINKYELNIKRAYLDDEENKAMTQDYLRSSNEEGILILKEYGFDYDSPTQKFSFYKKEPFEIDENSLNQHMLLTLNEKLDESNTKMGSVKGILLFFVVIQCIPIVLYLLGKIVGP